MFLYEEIGVRFIYFICFILVFENYSVRDVFNKCVFFFFGQSFYLKCFYFDFKGVEMDKLEGDLKVFFLFLSLVLQLYSLFVYFF